jgi:flagellar biosynthesis/type III secretory pathway M-ring protein FliF/YscJ
LKISVSYYNNDNAVNKIAAQDDLSVGNIEIKVEEINGKTINKKCTKKIYIIIEIVIFIIIIIIIIFIILIFLLIIPKIKDSKNKQDNIQTSDRCEKYNSMSNECSL